MNNKATDEYRTKDLGEASGLLCKSAKLLRLEKENNFFWFVFEDANLCESTANAYWYGKLTVNAREYYEATRDLKDRLFRTRDLRVEKGGEDT